MDKKIHLLSGITSAGRNAMALISDKHLYNLTKLQTIPGEADSPALPESSDY
jgi:hypothetical protein